MKETLRQVGKNLWVADLDSAVTVQDSFGLIIDCEGGGSCKNSLVMSPTGKTSHSWTARDLNQIISFALPALRNGKQVLLHCHRGVSRSACAAAAILIATGEAEILEDALAKVATSGRGPAVVTVSSLKGWFRDYRTFKLL